jgi:uncharacterized membrane protein YgcG
MAKKSSAKIEQAAEIVETTVTEAANDTVAVAADSVKAKFGKALEEAKASASALGKDLQEKAAPYREKLNDKLANTDFSAEAKALGEQARTRALALAADGKVKANDALSSLGKVVADNASLVDDKLGAKYGDYARTAARACRNRRPHRGEGSGRAGQGSRRFREEEPRHRGGGRSGGGLCAGADAGRQVV